MNASVLSNLPLIFHLVETTKIDTNQNTNVNLRHSIQSDFHQTPEFTPTIFYKPISKIC
jgi:hypothetical protein